MINERLETQQHQQQQENQLLHCQKAVNKPEELIGPLEEGIERVKEAAEKVGVPFG